MARRNVTNGRIAGRIADLEAEIQCCVAEMVRFLGGNTAKFGSKRSRFWPDFPVTLDNPSSIGARWNRTRQMSLAPIGVVEARSRQDRLSCRETIPIDDLDTRHDWKFPRAPDGQ